MPNHCQHNLGLLSLTKCGKLTSEACQLCKKTTCTDHLIDDEDRLLCHNCFTSLHPTTKEGSPSIQAAYERRQLYNRTGYLYGAQCAVFEYDQSFEVEHDMDENDFFDS